MVKTNINMMLKLIKLISWSQFQKAVYELKTWSLLTILKTFLINILVNK